MTEDDFVLLCQQADTAALNRLASTSAAPCQSLAAPDRPAAMSHQPVQGDRYKVSLVPVNRCIYVHLVLIEHVARVISVAGNGISASC